MNDTLSDKRSGMKEVVDGFFAEKFATRQNDFISGDATETHDEIHEVAKRTNWIASAASRISQIREVTHVIKATNAKIDASSIFFDTDSMTQHGLLESTCLPDNFTKDATGNAALFGVYKFLQLEYDGRTLLEWMRAQDPDLAAILSDDESLAYFWMSTFSDLHVNESSQSSHTFAKQIYWLIGEDPSDGSHFHLLSPLYPTSLVHAVFDIINEDRYGEKAKAARLARKDSTFSENEIHEYPNIAIQKMGGTKPQNVSFLNSKRSGNNYLLASVPPVWQERIVKPLFGPIGLFEYLAKKREVYTIVKELKVFLESDPPSNLTTRNHRDDLLDRLVSEIFQFVSEVWTLEPGWSEDKRCLLTRSERIWLDPDRSTNDTEFDADWKAEIRHRFANWLNTALGKGNQIPLGDAEHAFWMDTFHGQEWRAEQAGYASSEANNA